MLDEQLAAETSLTVEESRSALDKFATKGDEFNDDGHVVGIDFLYGAQANWENVSAPIVSYGRTVIAKKEQLLADLLSL